MKSADLTLIQSAFRVAKAAKAAAIFLALDPLKEIPDEEPPKGCRLILVSRRTPEELAAAFPNARLEKIPDSKTFIPEDQPERLAALIASFVREPSEALAQV